MEGGSKSQKKILRNVWTAPKELWVIKVFLTNLRFGNFQKHYRNPPKSKHNERMNFDREKIQKVKSKLV